MSEVDAPGSAMGSTEVRTRLIAAFHGLLTGMVGLFLVAGGTVLGAVPAAADEAPKVVLLLDVSGSMNDRLSSGGTKFAAAKRALKQVADALPAGTQVGLRVYGSEIAQPKKENPKACTDTRLVLPLGPLNRGQMERAVDSFDAKGETPIAYSMTKAVDDLGDSGKRVLILISDGEETCAGDPCPIAKKLADRGIDLQFNAIGLAVNSRARTQLQCIAKAGGGDYYDAGSTESLGDALRKLTQRALRPFEVSGTPVRATKDPGGAPEIGVGQYRDRYDTSGTQRYYTINRTPGSVVTASIGTVQRPVVHLLTENLSMTLSTLDGQKCSIASTSNYTVGTARVYGVAVRSAHSTQPHEPELPDACATAPQLRLAMNRTSTAGGIVPVELVVAEQPPATNLDDLPENVGNYTGRATKITATTPVRPVVGGSGFSDAAQVGSGSFADSIAFGETLVYRVRLDYGQRVRVTATVPGGRHRPSLDRYSSWSAKLRILTPAHLETVGLAQNAQAPQFSRITVASPQVRANNAELLLPSYQNAAPDASTASVAGDYYVALELEPSFSTMTGVVVPLQLDVAVDGTPSGRPTSAEPSTTPAATPAGDPSSTPGGSADTPTATPSSVPPDSAAESSGTGFLLGLGGGVIVAGVIGAVWLGLRKRARHHP